MKLMGTGRHLSGGKQGMRHGMYDYDIYDRNTGARQGF